LEETVKSSLIGDMARSIGLPGLKRAAGVVTRRLPIPQPLLLVGPGASARLGEAIADFGHRRVLLVTDPVVTKLGLLNPLTDALKARGTAFVVFDDTAPDAPLPQIERGIDCFKAADCDAIVALGGGSVMDAAKAIGLAAANGKHPRALVGYFKGLHGPVPIYAVPTTAGTGSEVTVAAVISDPEQGTKLVIADTRLVPAIAALDANLMTGLPPATTAATGMDALTHAIEAYIGQWGTAHTDRMALAAVGMIYRQLPLAWRDGADLQAREQMALAATYAGLAFTRANVGNVHAIAHQLGGRYHVPHGLANAILLPRVLRFTAPAVTAKLAVLARHAGVGSDRDNAAARARKFLDSVEALNESLGIPRHLETLQAADIPALAAAACWEADANYPVPRRMTQADCETLLRGVLPPTPAPATAPPAAKPRRTRRQNSV
jgi:alcohol dehydrogenase class IV